MARRYRVAIAGCHRMLDRAAAGHNWAAAFAGDPEVAGVAGRVDALAALPAGARQRLDPPGSCQLLLANGVEAFVSPAGAGVGFDVAGAAGRLLVLNDGGEARLWAGAEGGRTLVERELRLPPPAPAWPLAVADLLDAIAPGRPTRADVHAARRATEVGFAAHQSHREADRALCIESFPWGNE
jgi:hypothetical protein